MVRMCELNYKKLLVTTYCIRNHKQKYLFIFIWVEILAIHNNFKVFLVVFKFNFWWLYTCHCRKVHLDRSNFWHTFTLLLFSNNYVWRSAACQMSYTTSIPFQRCVYVHEMERELLKYPSFTRSICLGNTTTNLEPMQTILSPIEAVPVNDSMKIRLLWFRRMFLSILLLDTCTCV